MADALRTGVSVRELEVHIERPNGSRGVALVDMEAIKDGRSFSCRSNQQQNDGHFYRLALRLRTFQQWDQALTGLAPIPNLSKSNRGLFPLP